LKIGSNGFGQLPVGESSKKKTYEMGLHTDHKQREGTNLHTDTLIPLNGTSREELHRRPMTNVRLSERSGQRQDCKFCKEGVCGQDLLTEVHLLARRFVSEGRSHPERIFQEGTHPASSVSVRVRHRVAIKAPAKRERKNGATVFAIHTSLMLAKMPRSGVVASVYYGRQPLGSRVGFSGARPWRPCRRPRGRRPRT
jgi:hypothetical protein